MQQSRAIGLSAQVGGRGRFRGVCGPREGVARRSEATPGWSTPTALRPSLRRESGFPKSTCSSERAGLGARVQAQVGRDGLLDLHGLACEAVNTGRGDANGGNPGAGGGFGHCSTAGAVAQAFASAGEPAAAWTRSHSPLWIHEPLRSLVGVHSGSRRPRSVGEHAAWRGEIRGTSSLRRRWETGFTSGASVSGACQSASLRRR